MAMVLGYPWLQHLDALSLVIFYVNMLIASQFSGSVTAVAYGIPGEDTSFVASRLGFRYSVKGHGQYAMAITSFGSMLASVVSVIAVFAVIDYVSGHTVFYSARVQAIILALVYIILFLSEPRRWFAITQILLATALAMIGYNEIFTTSFTLGITELTEGLSWLPVILAVMVIPTLYNELWKSDTVIIPPQQSMGSLQILARFRRYLGTWAKSSAVGSIFGLIPGIGTTIVSTAVYSIIRRRSHSPARQLIAAESSNNSAVVSSLIPLITFGIPITASEAMLVNLLQGKHEIIFMEWFLQPVGWGMDRLELIMMGAVVTSIVSMFWCWQWVSLLLKTYFLQRRTIFIVLSTVLLATMFYQAWHSHRLILDFITFFALLPLGMTWRGRNVMIFLLSYIMFDTSSKVFWNFYQLL
jgi:TctA family transporter